MAFRFFINVDQCLNMNNFGFFFYKKRHDKEFHMTEDVYIGEGTGLSFAKAAADIQMYMDKFPYLVNDYQIIIAMRGDYNANVDVWGDTLLSRLLNIDFDLRRSDIIIRSGSASQIAVNLIMLYETNVLKSIHSLDDDYMSDVRLGKDCRLLLKEIGVPEDKENDLETLKGKWNAYLQMHRAEFEECSMMEDGITYAHPLCVFFNDLLKQYETDKKKEERSEVEHVSTLQALKEVLDGYQVFELLTNKQRDVDINALLRIVEFATTDFQAVEGISETVSLSELCKIHWNSIIKMEEADIRKRYAKMLYNYRVKLQNYANRETAGTGDDKVESALPDYAVPDDDEISIAGSDFESDGNTSKAKNDPKKQIQDFKENLSPVSTLMSRWESTYKDLKRRLSELDENLKHYASDLGDRYNDELKKRKEIEIAWKSITYVEGPTTKQDINNLEDTERQLLDKMDQPQMTPSLQFQDQLNMDTALEQENINITHFINCIQSASIKSFLLLILVIISMVAVQYGILQPYNFNTTETALYYVAYIGVSAVLMFLTWLIPLKYYKRKIHQCLNKLEKEMDKYISGYFEKAKHFHEYINLVNQLDYIERHLRLKKKAVKTTEWITCARAWHINQVKAHLIKLRFFDGLTGTYLPENSDSGLNDGDSLNSIPNISRDQVDDVIDNKLYWPQ